MEENQEILDSQNETEGAVEAQEEEATEEVAESSHEEKAARFTEREKQYYNRIKKLEAEVKSHRENPTRSQGVAMSDLDMVALVRADVHEDDMDRVKSFAASEGMSVREALKSDELQAILSVRKEKRQTASAANVGSSRRASGRLTDEALLENAKRGKAPQTEEDWLRLASLKG